MEIKFDSGLAMEQFKKRVAANKDKKQVNNASLHAGSPMYYYCRYCGDQTEVLPESHMRRPKTVCTPCEPLALHGLIK